MSTKRTMAEPICPYCHEPVTDSPSEDWATVMECAHCHHDVKVIPVVRWRTERYDTDRPLRGAGSEARPQGEGEER